MQNPNYNYGGAKIDFDMIDAVEKRKQRKKEEEEEEKKKKKARKKKVDSAISDIKSFKLPTGGMGTLE